MSLVVVAEAPPYGVEAATGPPSVEVVAARGLVSTEVAATMVSFVRVL